MLHRISLVLILLALSNIGWAQIFGPAATINGTDVSREKVEAQVNHMINQRGLNSGGITQPSMFQKIQQEVIEQLIVQELLWQEAKRREYVVEDEMVDERLRQMKSEFDTERAFLFRIEEGGYTEETFRENIRQQESVKRMIAQGIRSEIVISAEDIEQFYDTNIELMQEPLEVRARHILIKAASTAAEDHEAAKKEAESILVELRGNADFAELARNRSQDASARQGGDLGYFGAGMMVPAFEQAAFALQPGELSEIVQTQFGYHVIMVEDRRGGETVSLEEAGDQIRAYLEELALRQAVESLVTTLRGEGSVEIFLN